MVNVYIPKNNNLFIAIISIFIIVALIIYLKPSVFIFVFNTVLGNCLLGLFIILMGILVDFKWAIGFTALFIILYQTLHIKDGKEGFGPSSGPSNGSSNNYDSSQFNTSSSSESNAVYTATTWPQQTITNFINFQKVHNPNLIFDINILQQQATPDEVQYLFDNDVWPWSDDVKQMYQNAVAENWNINVNLGTALNSAQSIYNQSAAMELIAWNTKEGAFLIDGAVIGQSKNMPKNVNNVVRCANNSSGNNGLEQVIYTGYNSLNGSLQSQVTPVANENIPSVVNGFQFLNGPCNPCSALDNPPNYSCPFSINTGNGATVSPIWQKLWGSDSEGGSGLGSGLGSGGSAGGSAGSGIEAAGPGPETVTGTLAKKQFPLLSQLTDELSAAAVPLIESVLSKQKPPPVKMRNNVGVSTNPPDSVTRATSSNPAMTNDSASGENYRVANMGN